MIRFSGLSAVDAGGEDGWQTVAGLRLTCERLAGRHACAAGERGSLVAGSVRVLHGVEGVALGVDQAPGVEVAVEVAALSVLAVGGAAAVDRGAVGLAV